MIRKAILATVAAIGLSGCVTGSTITPAQVQAAAAAACGLRADSGADRQLARRRQRLVFGGRYDGGGYCAITMRGGAEDG